MWLIDTMMCMHANMHCAMPDRMYLFGMPLKSYLICTSACSEYILTQNQLKECCVISEATNTLTPVLELLTAPPVLMLSTPSQTIMPVTVAQAIHTTTPCKTALMSHVPSPTGAATRVNHTDMLPAAPGTELWWESQFIENVWQSRPPKNKCFLTKDPDGLWTYTFWC